MPSDAHRGPHLGQGAPGNAEQVAQVGGPVARAQVVEHRPRGVRRIRRVLAREVPDQPGVDRAEDRAPVARPLGEAVDLAQEPFDLRRREVRVQDEARVRADERLVPGGAQLVAAVGRAPVLPDDRAMQRLARHRIPHAHRLALIGDPDRAEAAVRDPGVRERLQGDRARRLPDLAGIVLDQAGAREMLLQLAVGAPDELRLVVEDQAGAARRALVDRENPSRHRRRSLPRHRAPRPCGEDRRRKFRPHGGVMPGPAAASCNPRDQARRRTSCPSRLLL